MPREPIICVIDDDLSFLAAMRSLLRSLGYRAECFASAEDFLAAGGGERFSCIISDIQMPGLSGIELRMLLAQRHSGVPVILVTGRGDIAEQDRARASGALCLLSKPCAADALIGCLDIALGR